MLPVFLDFSKHNASAQVIGAPLLLLIWLYVMANLIVFGAEVNWRRATALSAAAARARWEFVRFQSSPSSATVRVSPSGTNTGS